MEYRIIEPNETDTIGESFPKKICFHSAYLQHISTGDCSKVDFEDYRIAEVDEKGVIVTQIRLPIRGEINENGLFNF